MITYICSIINNDQIQEYVGIALMILEALLVLIKFLQYIVDPQSRFGKFLSKLLKGTTFLKGEAKNLEQTIKKEGEEHDRRGNESEDSGSGNGEDA